MCHTNALRVAAIFIFLGAAGFQLIALIALRQLWKELDKRP